MNRNESFPRRGRRRFLAGAALLGLLAACGQQVPKVSALDPGDETACALDGMLLKDYPGPKGQMHYAEGKPDFYCDLMDLFSVLLAPERKRVMTAVFVQDMGKTDWDHPNGHWIDAKSAVYVVGSRKLGSMGPTLASFARMENAEEFAAKEGGKLVGFEQVTANMVHAGGGMH